MNVFDEFDRLVRDLEEQGVRYALVGGVAVAFYTEPRFTRDIDLLVEPDDFETTRIILETAGYFESSSPWTFSNTLITLHRFLKTSDEGEMMIDILLPGSDEIREMISHAVLAESAEGSVRLVSREDLIQLKRARGSKQDQADIEKLEQTEND